jgi:DNA-binding SARP family transcriptional activator
VLGPLVAWHGVQEVRLPRSHLLRGVLGALLIADSPLGADRLIDLVWGAGQAETVRPGSVHVAMSRLRRWLASVPDGDAEILERAAGGYRLRISADAVDLFRYRQLVEQAAATGDPGRRLELLAGAGGLYRGPLLADVVRIERADRLLQSLTAEVRQGLLALADTALEAGRPEAASPTLERAAHDDPLDEQVHARLILVLGAAGREAEALRHYERQRQVLAEELGILPGRQLRRAHEAVLSGQYAPEHTIRPGHLPIATPDFTGRDTELRRLTDLLVGPKRHPSDPPHVGIATISGSAGVGKTALALQVAHLLRDRFPDGQLYAQLRGAHPRAADPGEVLGRFLTALGQPADSLPRDVEERAELYRSIVAERQVLVLLDDAADEKQVRPLLPGGASCGVLVTSRRRLPALGAAGMELGALETETALRLLARMVGDERVATQPAVAAELVTLCGHVPLALRIAGSRLARLPHRPLGWLVERMADDRRRLDELILDDLAVRASLEPSYRALGEDARRLLRSLGLLHAPDFAAWVAASLLDAGMPTAEDCLDELVDAFLVDVVGVDAAGQTRYRLHDLVRVLARERCEAEESAETRSATLLRAMRAWYRGVALAARELPHTLPPPPAGPDDAAPAGPGPGGAETSPAVWLQAEGAALLATAHQAAEAGADDLCWRMATYLHGWLERFSSFEEWAALDAVALEAARRTGDPRGEALMLLALGELAADKDRYEEAKRSFDAAQERLVDVADPLLLAHVRRAKGVTAKVLGQLDEARADLDRAAAVFTVHGDTSGLAAAAHGLGAIHRDQGRLAEAEDCYTTALEGFATIGDDFSLASVLVSLAIVQRLRGRAAEAGTSLRRGWDICRRRGFRQLEAYPLIYLGELHTELGDHAAARDLVGQARTRAEDVDDSFAVALALRILGEIERASGDLEAAETALDQALLLWERIDAPLHIARTLDGLGRVHEARGHRSQARDALARAHALYRKLDAPEAEPVAARLAALAEAAADSAVVGEM